MSIRNKRLLILQQRLTQKKGRNPWFLADAATSKVTAVFVTKVPDIHTLFRTARVLIKF
jgi:sodium/potassium-transporting ATPase subunit alpha